MLHDSTEDDGWSDIHCSFVQVQSIKNKAKSKWLFVCGLCPIVCHFLQSQLIGCGFLFAMVPTSKNMSLFHPNCWLNDLNNACQLWYRNQKYVDAKYHLNIIIFNDVSYSVENTYWQPFEQKMKTIRLLSMNTGFLNHFSPPGKRHAVTCSFEKINMIRLCVYMCVCMWASVCVRQPSK